jgi:regulator of protease activity HflC (stomatin/prohibitin superfamily)
MPYTGPRGMAEKYPNVSRMFARMGIWLALIVLVGALGAGCMTTMIGSGEAGVRYSIFGGTDLNRVYDEGMNVHAPWVKVFTYDVRVQERLEDLTALSVNGLSIGLDVSIRWRPIRENLPMLHVTYGTDYDNKLVMPELRSAAREIVGQFTPEELYSSRRTELQEQILNRVRTGVEGRFVAIETILIRNVILPEQIRRAIENKLTEEQEVERYFFTLQKDSLEAERKRIEALGQAEYQRIITESLTPQFLQFKGIEATQKLAESPNAKTVIVGSGKDGLPIILGDQ